MNRALMQAPFARFDALLTAAKAVDTAVLPEPTAFSLGTVGADGHPAVRILLLKGMDERGFVPFDFSGESRPNGHLVQIDLIFVRRESPLRPTSIIF